MDEGQAQEIAQALGGNAWNSGGGICLVKIERADGHLVVISDEVICEYESESDFDNSNPLHSILLH